MWLTDNSDPRVFEFGADFTPELHKRVRPDDPSNPHFNGYGINPESRTTVAELIRFYIEGEPIMPGAIKPTPESMERGQPICGDTTARWRSWRGPAQHWPKHAEAGTPYPGPRRAPAPAVVLPPAPPKAPPGGFEDQPLF